MNLQHGAQKAANSDKSEFWNVSLPKYLNYFVLVLAFGLIAFISWDTYKGADYLENDVYMGYQLVACIFFLAEYFYRFIISSHKLRFIFWAMPFFLISIPYLNIIEYFDFNVSHEVLVYFCFVPILRGLIALVMVVAYVTENLSTTVFAAYALVLAPVVYMSGLIFYVAEKDVNPAIKSLWYAMWWAGMNVTTIGCYINPVTSTGMILGLLLSLLGIIMLPLFTVYFGNVVSKYSHKKS